MGHWALKGCAFSCIHFSLKFRYICLSMSHVDRERKGKERSGGAISRAIPHRALLCSGEGVTDDATFGRKAGTP